MMAQNTFGRYPMEIRGKSGGLPSQVISIELKHRILSALSKLADRDTHQIALEELEKIVRGLSPEGVSICLSCLYDTDCEQKSVVRRECVKLFGTIANVHGDGIALHLTKIISNIVKRIKDPDSNVRDTCPETMGIFAAQYLSANSTVRDNGDQSGSGSAVALFTKPLFEVMNEQNKNIQTCAAACLAKVIENAKDPPLVAFQHLCPRICKYLSNPTFLAKSALLSVIASLAQVGSVSQEYLSILMPCIHESLESSDWATRKAAADTLIRMANHLNNSLSASKSATLLILEACRFDKVKRVRDSVAEALQLWKNIADPEAESCIAHKNPSSDFLDNESSEMSQKLKHFGTESRSPTGSQVSSADKDAMNNAYRVSDYIVSFQCSKGKMDKPGNTLKKRVLSDKKINPEFFQKLVARGSDDWQVEVAVPHGCPPVQTQHEEEIEDINMNLQDTSSSNTVTSSELNGSEQSSPAATRQVENIDLIDNSQRSKNTYDRTEITDSFLQDKLKEDGDLWNKKPQEIMPEKEERDDHNQRDMPVAIQPWDSGGPRIISASSGSSDNDQGKSNKDYWHVIKRQLSQLEQQQASLMEMLKELIQKSQDGMASIENRLQVLEQMVEDMSRDVAILTGRQGNSPMMGFENAPNRSLQKNYAASDHSNPKYGTGNEGGSTFPERFFSFNDIQSANRRARESSWGLSNAGTDMCNNQAHEIARHDHVLEGQNISRRDRHGVLNQGRSSRNDSHNGNQFANTRGWDSRVGHIRLGEGPSARSVWQASKDEATLAAIRVAGEDAGASEVEALPESFSSRTSSRVTNPQSNAEGMQYKSGGGMGQFWTLWSRAMECLHSGDIDQAYVEVLCTGDEVLLVRLMNRTGPVLDQISTGTVNDVLHAIGQLLQQQSFFDFGIPWIQQVSNMISESGLDCLELSLEAKKELLLCLQEASSMDLPGGWDGNTMDELFHQLANAWSIDFQNVSSN